MGTIFVFHFFGLSPKVKLIILILFIPFQVRKLLRRGVGLPSDRQLRGPGGAAILRNRGHEEQVALGRVQGTMGERVTLINLHTKMI